jgi:predicted MPP superfamily phosphohydrolase
MLLVLWIILATIAAAVLYASVIERNWFALRRHRVPCLPPGSSPVRVLHISDLHLRTSQRRKRRFIERLARVDADLIVGTGDFLGDRLSLEATVSAMTALPAKRGALFVLGSNDYYAPRFKNPFEYLMKNPPRRVSGTPNPWRDMVSRLTEHGWLFMNNRTAQIEDIDVVGLDDAHIRRADLEIASARAGSGFRLAITHSPDIAEDLAELGYDLIVCGHTHGGQLCIPGFGALITNSKLPRKMASGLHRLNGSWLHVCAGLGTSMYAPVRFACRPEACVLELVPRDGS